jgi:hypothetical protein
MTEKSMADLTRDERLALVVRAEVAQFRADQATWRAEQAGRRVKPYMDAVERFEQSHGRRYDDESMTDLAEVIALGGPAAEAVGPEDFQAAITASLESSRLSAEAAAAMRAVLAQMRAGGSEVNILEWAGVDLETVTRATHAALAEEGGSTD